MSSDGHCDQGGRAQESTGYKVKSCKISAECCGFIFNGSRPGCNKKGLCAQRQEDLTSIKLQHTQEKPRLRVAWLC